MAGTEIGRFAGAPVRVTGGFFLMAAVLWLLSGGLSMGLLAMVAWLPMVAGSLLVHEAGHALVARANHQRVTEIVLRWTGGRVYTQGILLPATDLRISLAGPAASFALAALLTALSWLPLGAFAGLLAYAAALNVTWGVFNLLPLPGNDGFHALRALTKR